jgi:putative tryptophan/tyrosine transport system substrate-binding protein
MRRRDFITLLGGAAAAWPFAAHAQQPAMPVIGFVHLTSIEQTRAYLTAFHRGLNDTGFAEGRNVAIEYRWGQGQNDRLPMLVAELVRRQVSVLVTLESTLTALAAKAATQSIPILFMQGADPVRIGLVSSLSRPDGNLTGINLFLAEVAGKRLQLLRETVPSAKAIAYLLCRERNQAGRGCGARSWSAPFVGERKQPWRDRRGLCEFHAADG